MGFATSTVKYILFVFNLLCALVGLAVVALGAVYLSNLKSLKDFVDSVKAVNLPIIVIALGCLIFIIAFFGCCGAIRESHCMMMTYSVFLFILLLLQIIAVVFLFVNQQTIKTEFGRAVEKTWEKAQQNREAMSSIEQSFQCCGNSGPQDYFPAQIPQSCCPYGHQGECVSPTSFNQKGCKDTVPEILLKIIKSLAYVGLTIFGVELVGFIFACCLANHIRNHERRNTY